MDKRTIVKMIVKTLVVYVSGQAIEKTLVTVAPSTKKFKAAEFTGAIGGWYIAESLEPRTDELVDTMFDNHEARKALAAH